MAAGSPLFCFFLGDAEEVFYGKCDKVFIFILSTWLSFPNIVEHFSFLLSFGPCCFLARCRPTFLSGIAITFCQRLLLKLDLLGKISEFNQIFRNALLSAILLYS